MKFTNGQNAEAGMITGQMALYSASLSMFGAKVQIALIEKAIDYQLVMVPYDRERG